MSSYHFSQSQIKKPSLQSSALKWQEPSVLKVLGKVNLFDKHDAPSFIHAFNETRFLFSRNAMGMTWPWHLSHIFTSVIWCGCFTHCWNLDQYDAWEACLAEKPQFDPSFPSVSWIQDCKNEQDEMSVIKDLVHCGNSRPPGTRTVTQTLRYGIETDEYEIRRKRNPLEKTHRTDAS